MGQLKITDGYIYSPKAIFYKKSRDAFMFLVVIEPDNSRWTFVGGAQEKGDKSVVDTLRREILEEINLKPSQYDLKHSGIVHEFKFEDKTSARYGKKGKHDIFFVRYISKQTIIPTAELASVEWLSEKETLSRLESSYFYWPDLFRRAIAVLKSHSL